MTHITTDTQYRTNRADNKMRTVTMELGFNPYAEGSCLIKVGHTHVVCNATFETRVPPFVRGTGKGWITAEYGMLPRSTHSRMHRKKVLESGRTQEIQRLIGRSLRAVVDLSHMGETQIHMDCDVIQADGGTRTAAITGAYIALKIAEQYALKNALVAEKFVIDSVAAVSCGLLDNRPILDLQYYEDSNADADANFILTGTGKVVEIQATAEHYAFDRAEFNTLFDLAELGCQDLHALQQHMLAKHGIT